ncbi:MAG: stage 0 sporulation family protein [Clostridia bacterium]|nr:stage 0 sporulation family protein [Clostridia bacterium]
MVKIVGVKFRNTPKTYYFSPENGKTYEDGQTVVVETAKGLECGTIVGGVTEVEEDKIVPPLRPIIRFATQKDLARIKENEEKIPEAMSFMRNSVAELGLEMKLIGCEFSFDGKKITFFFSAEKRVDFRDLVKILASHFKLRVELRQVGIRDETKLLGGIAPCGRPCCCSGSMPDFAKVSIKMAKNQGLHLNPAKISGLCGRLMCCLQYENDYYEKACKLVPKVGGTVVSPDGEGTVVSNDMLKMISKVKIVKSDGGEIYKDFAVSDLEFARKSKAEEPAEKDNDTDVIPENLREEDAEF